jgi:hypothetical protein
LYLYFSVLMLALGVSRSYIVTGLYIQHVMQPCNVYLDGCDLASAPIVSCAKSNRMDVPVYGAYQSTFTFDIRRWVGLQWEAWQGESSNIKGDPFAISIGSDRTDYFGIGDVTWHQSRGATARGLVLKLKSRA